MKLKRDGIMKLILLSIVAIIIGYSSNAQTGDTYGIIIDWDPSISYEDGTDVTPADAATIVYVLYAAYEDSGFIRWYEVIRQKSLEFQFDSDKPFCIVTKTKSYLPAEDSYSEFSDPTKTCIDKDRTVTNEYGYVAAR